MSRRRGRFALRSSVVAGLVALAAFPATAPAENNPSDPNPLSTNVPYLAWRGEHVRLVKCTGDLPGAEADAIRAADTRAGDGIWLPEVNADVLVEDWSGPAAFQPQVARGTIDLFLSSDGLCIKADVISQKAGLAQVKLVVTLDPAHRDSTIADILTRSEILGVHQFLVGWMALDGPALTELPVGGDAGHLNNFVASDDPRDDGVLRVAVTGTIPLGNNFSELGLGESITLPADWPRLAGAMASDRNPDNADPAYRWDIHDDQALTEGHPAYGFPCNREAPTAPVTATYGDAVDNCEGGSAFSRFFDADGPAGPLQPISLALTTPDSIGPFDPQRPDETFLPDGFLTASDAPMPAARIDVSIAPNAGGDDLDGLGSLHRTDKQGLYSRDRAPLANSGSGSGRPHNLYAPFYSAWIPATATSGCSATRSPAPTARRRATTSPVSWSGTASAARATGPTMTTSTTTGTSPTSSARRRARTRPACTGPTPGTRTGRRRTGRSRSPSTPMSTARRS